MTTRTLRSLALASSAVALTAGLATLAGPATGAPGPRAQAAASASPSASASTSPRPSATAAPAPSGAPSECTVATTSTLSPTVTVAGRAAQVTVDATPGSTVRLLAYSRPSGSYFQARESVVPQEGRLVFTVFPPTNSSLYAEQVGCDAADTLSLGVRTAVGISAVRNGVRDYTFTGGTLPRRPGQLVSLFRVTASGAEVLTAQARTDSSGRWTVRRTFTGSGRFGFVARTASDATNLAGASTTRPTVIH